MLVVACGGAITYHGITGGAWIWGLVYGVAFPGVTLAEWVVLRRASADAKLAADRMFVAFALILTGLAMPAIDQIEADIRGGVAK